MVNGWKVTAIIFLILFILENIFIGYGLYLIGVEAKKDSECSLDICRDEPYYIYDTNRDLCYCYDEDWETIKQVNMGG